MKTLAIITLLFFSTHLFGQTMEAKEIEACVKEINSLKAKNKLQKVFYPNMSVCGGGLYGYYHNENLILIEATYQAEIGFSSRTIYLKDTLFIHINYREHFAEWEKYYQQYPAEKYEWDPSKMTFTDTLYSIALSHPINFTKQAGNKIINKKVDLVLIDELVRCGREMKKELAEVKTNR